MTTITALGLAGAAPLAALAVVGASAPPAAATFHGRFTAADLTACPVMPAPATVTGTWNVLARDDGSALVHVLVKFDGRVHAVWTMPFDVTSQSPTGVSATTTGIFPGDVLTVTVIDGRFTYRLVSPTMGCTASMGGPQQS